MENSNGYSYLSPLYIVELVPKIEDALWERFDASKYTRVRHYILRWHESNDSNNYNDFWENFQIHYKDDDRKYINLTETLFGMPNDVLIKIAIELGIDTPAFLPSIPTFKNVLKDNNENAYQTFERALKNVEDNPDESVSLANATLESLLKTILSDPRLLDHKYNEGDTLYDLCQKVLKAFKAFPSGDAEIKEISNIGSGLLNVCKNIESLRSTKTKSHGKAKDEYIINDPLWAHFVINAVASVGMLMINYFNARYPAETKKATPEVVDGPIDLSEIPF